jgi:hypothetical protein
MPQTATATIQKRYLRETYKDHQLKGATCGGAVGLQRTAAASPLLISVNRDIYYERSTQLGPVSVVLRI